MHRVSVGGPDYGSAFGVQPGCDADFSLSAIQFANGTVKGEYTDRFLQGYGGFHATIDCLAVSDNTARISGVVTSGWVLDGNGDVVDVTGEPVTTIVVDNGNNAQDPADQIGFSNVGDATPCTDPDPGYELFDVPQG